MKENPYLRDQIVQEPGMFIGRGALLSRIYEVIAANGSISLVGPPRIGKGSILNGLRFKELQQSYGGIYREKLRCCIFVFADMRIYAHRNWDSFFKRLNREIVAQSRGALRLDGVSLEGSEGFTSLVDEITDQDYRLVLALDSFEKLKENERLSGLLPMFLRSEAARVSYVVASTVPLNEIFPKEPLSSPFYNIFLYCKEVGGLTPADARLLVTQPMINSEVPFSNEEVEWILKQAGTHPFFLKRVCQIIFDQKALAPNASVSLDEGEEEAYQILFPHFMGIWYGMNERQQEQFSYELGNPETEVFYEGALFRRFVQAQFTEEATIKVEEIKDALKQLHDTPLLGKSRLRHLKVVANYLNGNLQPSPSEIGLALRAMLTEALESLKGSEYRTDLDPEWEAYNILFYRYFKHHMRNEHIGARLAMSTRTYYRNKNEALKRILQAIQEMENNYIANTKK